MSVYINNYCFYLRLDDQSLLKLALKTHRRTNRHMQPPGVGSCLVGVATMTSARVVDDDDDDLGAAPLPGMMMKLVAISLR